MNNDCAPDDHGSATGLRVKWVFMAFVAIAAYLVVAEHRAHLSGVLYYWPFLLLIACPLMHIFMHRGHGGDPGQGGHRARGTRNERNGP